MPPVTEKFVDWEMSLRTLEGNVEMAKEMLRLLAAELPPFKLKLQACLANQDTEALNTLAHKLHGGSLYCGVAPLQKQCLLVEQATLADKPIDVNEVALLTNTLLRIVDQTIAELEPYKVTA